MTRQQTRKAIVRRINHLNRLIDVRIALGKSYSMLAKEHKGLLFFLKENF